MPPDALAIAPPTRPAPQPIIYRDPNRKRRKPLVVRDLFCGAGGFSLAATMVAQQLGLELDLVGYNHNQHAIATHAKNLPEFEHKLTDLTTARPEKEVPGGWLDLLIAAPTCTGYSQARGGRPTNDQERADPWIVNNWATIIRTKRLLLENVPQIMDWGPVNPRTGKPIKSRKGEYFRAWIASLRAIGFVVEWKLLCCADYGDATTRTRFFLQARSDGKKITWPQPTHAPAAQARLLGLTPYRTARNAINWSNRGTSIYTRPKPLAVNTLRRIEAGLVKLGGPAGAPYLPRLRREIERSRIYYSLTDQERAIYRAWFKRQLKARLAPMPAHDGQPAMIVKLRGTSTVSSIDAPLPTESAGGKHFGLAELPPPFILNRHGENGGDRVHSVDNPTPASTTRGCGYLVQPDTPPADSTVEPIIVNLKGRSDASPSDIPLPAQTTIRHLAIAEPMLITVAHGDLTREKNAADRRAHSVDQPFQAFTAGGKQVAVVQPVGPDPAIPTAPATPAPVAAQDQAADAQAFVMSYYGETEGRPRSSRSVDEPFPTASTEPRFALVMQMNQGDGRTRNTRTTDDPFVTITATGTDLGLVQAAPPEPFLLNSNHADGDPNRIIPVSESFPTQTSKRGLALVDPQPADRPAEPPSFIVPNFGERRDKSGAVTQEPRFHTVDQPMPSATSHGAGGLVQPFVAQLDQTGGNGSYVRAVDNPLFTAVTKRNQALVEPVELVEDDYDIYFRMITNDELAEASSFNIRGKYLFSGNEADITQQIGNAVPVCTGMALLRSILADATSDLDPRSRRTPLRDAA